MERTQKKEEGLTVLTVTRKGAAAADAGSMVGVALSAGLPGTLRRRPVLSGGDSVEAGRRVVKQCFLIMVSFSSKCECKKPSKAASKQLVKDGSGGYLTVPP